MIVTDYLNRKPMYEQIVERFQLLIVTGAIEPDSQIPSVRSLAVDLAINPNAVQKAYALLEKEGYIYPVSGQGNYVSGNSEVKAKKQETLYKNLQEVISFGHELGISLELILDKSKEYYREKQNDRN